MMAMSDIFGTVRWYALCIVSFVLLTGALAAMMRTLRAERGKKFILFSVTVTVLCFVLFVILMDFGHSVKNTTGYYAPFQRTLFAVPWLFYGGWELLMGVLLLCAQFEHGRYKTNRLTPDAIRRTVNLLPDGIAVSDAGGTVWLANLKMEALCRELTGEILSDAKVFLEKLHATSLGEDGRLLVKTGAGEVWHFEEESISVNEATYRQIVAHNVTERYRITEELKEKQARLRDVQRRMRAVSELSGDMFTSQEQAKARAALHNQLGQVLLMGRHYLKHPESTDPKLVYTLTGQMNRFLLGEAEESQTEEPNTLEEAVRMAKGVGVTVHLSGVAPQEAPIRGLLAQAIAECATNAVKHAEGYSLYVICEYECGDAKLQKKYFRATLTNSGRPPKGSVAESGGLLSLRQKIESAGGSMNVESAPAFVLTMKIEV